MGADDTAFGFWVASWHYHACKAIRRVMEEIACARIYVSQSSSTEVLREKRVRVLVASARFDTSLMMYHQKPFGNPLGFQPPCFLSVHHLTW